MRRDIAWHLVIIWASATVSFFAFQYATEGHLNTDELFYLIPVCTACYLFGRNDGQRKGAPVRPDVNT